ncbi:MAG: hypothetical protein H7Y27_15550 [Gemmatimonadaceae bacterium]|nr:hypothetical protein [Chitinophagaceae bacterium]
MSIAQKMLGGMLLCTLFSGCCREAGFCPEPDTREFALKGFNKILASDEFIFVITRCSDSTKKVRAKGCATDIADLKLELKDGVMEMRYKKYRSDRHLIEFEVSSPVEVEVSFFKTPRIYRKNNKT